MMWIAGISPLLVIEAYIAALVAFAVILFRYSLPRGGKTSRFVRTTLEPYAVPRTHALCQGKT
jgi:hypothetical protein